MDKAEIQAIYQRLSAPFLPSEVYWRVQRVGVTSNGQWAMVLPYVTARAIMNRLDDVFGVNNWRDTYREYKTDGVLCTLCVRIGDEWLCKQDVAPDTHIEKIKGGVSDALKRAAVKFGIGRYLYDLSESYVTVYPKKPEGQKSYYVNAYVNSKKRDKKVVGYFIPPALPEWAVNDMGQIVDAFAIIDVSKHNLETYLGHSLLEATNDEIVDLRNIYQSIATKQATKASIFGRKKPIKTTATMDKLLHGKESK